HSISYFYFKNIFMYLYPSLRRLITSSQSLAYAISKFISDVLSDQMSAQRLFSVGLFMVGSINVVFSQSSSVAVFSGLWFLARYGSDPVIHGLRSEPSQFGTWWSLISCSMNLAGGLGPIIATLMAQSYSWRFTLSISGLTCVTAYTDWGQLFLIQDEGQSALMGTVCCLIYFVFSFSVSTLFLMQQASITVFMGSIMYMFYYNFHTGLYFFAGCFGGFLSGLPFGTIAKHYGCNTAFWVAEITCTATTVGYVLLWNIRTKMGSVPKKAN
uniref:Solute carrier family 37 member 4a n=1 Tax=Sinocyclocheilus grahami TaxID=75366 RepID=A0A672RG94_SINGR